MKTYSAKADEIQKNWYVVDAQGKTLGRLASQIAHVLRGKHKPTYTPHMDCGDFVIVINAEKVHTTGRKLTQKMYYRHSGYHGGLTETSLRDQLRRFPERVIEAAVKGMLPRNRLSEEIYGHLKVYRGSDHPHAAQKPQVLELLT